MAKMYKFDILFFMFVFLSIIFYSLIGIYTSFSFLIQINESFSTLIKNFSYNTLANYYMGIGIVYITANLGEKYLSDNHTYEISKEGKLPGKTRRKVTLWIVWTIYTILNMVSYFINTFLNIDMNFDIIALLGNYTVISGMVMGAETSQGLLASIPSPISKFLVEKVEQKKEEVPPPQARGN